MSLIGSIRDIQQIIERIPAPGAIVYDATAAKLLRKPEEGLAQIISEKITSGLVLDLGSGTGYLSIEIAKNRPDVTVCGIDLSKKMVDIARRHARGVRNVRFIYGNAARLPFEDNSVDFVVSTGSLHHWKHPVAAFNECYRVLKAGGEGWIYDGYSDFPRQQAGNCKRKYGCFTYKLLGIALKFHGFTQGEYQGRIKSALEQSQFKDNYQMEPTDVWMKITVKKPE